MNSCEVMGAQVTYWSGDADRQGSFGTSVCLSGSPSVFSLGAVPPYCITLLDITERLMSITTPLTFLVLLLLQDH